MRRHALLALLATAGCGVNEARPDAVAASASRSPNTGELVPGEECGVLIAAGLKSQVYELNRSPLPPALVAERRDAVVAAAEAIARQPEPVRTDAVASGYPLYKYVRINTRKYFMMMGELEGKRTVCWFMEVSA